MLWVLLQVLINNTKISYCSSKAFIKKKSLKFEKNTEFRHFFEPVCGVGKRRGRKLVRDITENTLGLKIK